MSGCHRKVPRVGRLAARAIPIMIWPLCGLCQEAAPASAPGPTMNSREALISLAKLQPSPCGTPYEETPDADEIESTVLSRAADSVMQALNEAPAGSAKASERAEAALVKIEQLSSEVNAGWPAENRFHFTVLDDDPLVIVKVGVRVDKQFFAFGVPETDGYNKPNRLWREVGTGERLAQELDLYPLHRGPSRAARFLTASVISGCAGSVGVAYSAWEWNPGELEVDEIINTKGALGLDDKVPGFEPIGNLRTDGAQITLPLCEFTPIDTWDSPSLCEVDTYDLSGDEAKFRSRVYNRPDLVPIARAIEHAESRDYPAVLAYCATPRIAERLVDETPPLVFAGDLRVKKVSNTEEQVSFDQGYEFVVARRGHRWLIVGLTEK
jgi:hypothetical protein